MGIWRVAAMAVAGTVLMAAEAAPDVAALGWMSGSWVSETEGASTEEVWTRPKGGMMIGAALSAPDGKTSSFEHMRIAAGEDGAVAFYGMPGGAPAVRFAMAKGGADEAVFENPDHDYPQRVSYRLEGETLVATVSLIDGSRAQSWRYRRMD